MATTDVLVPLQQEDGNLTPPPKIEYDVIMHYKLDKLIKDVNTRLEQGRQTEGGIQVSNGASIMYYQTLIRWNVDANTDADRAIHTPGLENEPDLYEDVTEDATNG